jgi:hypothetical protein
MNVEAFHQTVWKDEFRTAVSPRPGLWLGRCMKCGEWRPLASWFLKVLDLPDWLDPDTEPTLTRDLLTGNLEARPFLFCIPCDLTEMYDDDEDEDEDPLDSEDLPEEFRPLRLLRDQPDPPRAGQDPTLDALIDRLEEWQWAHYLQQERLEKWREYLQQHTDASSEE